MVRSPGIPARSRTSVSHLIRLTDGADDASSQAAIAFAFERSRRVPPELGASAAPTRGAPLKPNVTCGTMPAEVYGLTRCRCHSRPQVMRPLTS